MTAGETIEALKAIREDWEGRDVDVVRYLSKAIAHLEHEMCSYLTQWPPRRDFSPEPLRTVQRSKRTKRQVIG